MPSTFLQYLFMLSGYPLARWVLPHISSREHAIIVHLTIGISFCSFIFGQEILLAFTMISIGYFILDKNPNEVFKVSFIMNSVIHFIQFCYSSHHEVSNLTMIVFYKIVATSFNLDDGRKIKLNDKHLTENQRSLHLTKKPTFYEWIAYCFTPFGSISNSFYEFKFFDRLLEIGTKKQTVSDTSKAKAKDRLIRSFFHGLIYFTFRHPLEFSFYQTECFHSFNLLARLFFVLLLGVTIYCKDFMFWNSVDAGLYEAGFADYGIEPEEDYTSLTFEYLLSMETIEEWSFAFNHTNEVFWLKYLTSRASLDNGLVEFIVKPIYKGFWGGIMLASFEKILFLLAEDFLYTFLPFFAELFSPFFTESFLPLFTESVWPTYIFVQVMMVLNRISIRNKTMYSFFYMNYVIYFISWLLSVFLAFLGFLSVISLKREVKLTEYFKDVVKERLAFSIIPESLNIVEEPYTQWAGINKIEGATDDKFGNVQGSQYDLANDGAFKGYTVILVLQFGGISLFAGPIKALKRKGFDVKVIHSPLRSGETSLQSLLTIDNSQLWFISTNENILSDSDIQAVKNYFLKGHGVYIWGENEPYFKDANRLLENILGSSVQLSGNDRGDKVLSIQKTTNGEGIIPNHPISTGIVNFYEGDTISSVPRCNEVTPLVYNSAGNILTSFYDKDGKRMMIDGGYTRLLTIYWNTAGTKRLIVNAAAWLANIERFGYHPQK